MIMKLIGSLRLASEWLGTLAYNTYDILDKFMYHLQCDKVVQQLLRHTDKELRDIGVYRQDVYRKAHKHCRCCNPKKTKVTDRELVDKLRVSEGSL